MMQMQIPTPSAAHHSLLSEFFDPNKSASEDVQTQSRIEKQSLTHRSQLQPQRLGFATPSFALRAEALPLQERSKHDQQQQRPSRTSRPRGTTRKRSPSQKILNLTKHHQDAAPTPPMTCFSVRTLEQEYEKDTQRMLERIQKSRSFEKKDPAPETNNPLQWSCPQLTSYPEEAAFTANATFSSDQHSDFFIGDIEEDEDPQQQQQVDHGFVFVHDTHGEPIPTEPPCYEDEDEDEEDGIFALEL